MEIIILSVGKVVNCLTECIYIPDRNKLKKSKNMSPNGELQTYIRYRAIKSGKNRSAYI